MTDGAFQYGLFLGSFERAIGEMYKRIHEGYKAGLNPPTEDPYERVERIRAKRYQKIIKAENEFARAQIKVHAAQVRRDLGLRPETDPRKNSIL